MPANNYIRLVNNGATLDKRFKVLFEGYRPSNLRKQTLQESATGKVRMQDGSRYRVWSFVLRVPYSVTDSNYGTLANLETFLDYKSPPNNVITFYDHFGTSYLCYLIGDHSPILQTPYLDNEDTFYIAPILLREKVAK